MNVVNSPRKVFLETTIQIERITYSEYRRQQIHRLLSDYTLMTSSYVFMEYRRVVLQTYAYLLTTAQKMQREGKTNIRLSEFAQRLSLAHSIRFKPRVLQSLLLIFGMLHEAFELPVVSAEDLIDYLEINMGRVAVDAFFHGIDEFITATDCDLSSPDALVGDYINTRLSCNAATATCGLVSFLELHKEKLHTLEQALAAAPPEKVNPRTLQALRRVNADIAKALGERTCWALGDIIIALEVPDDALIYTTDRHFDIICAALSKQMFVEIK